MEIKKGRGPLEREVELCWVGQKEGLEGRKWNDTLQGEIGGGVGGVEGLREEGGIAHMPAKKKKHR